METIVQLRGVRKTFNGYPALDNVNLDIDRGRVVGLLGKNGSGKTTLLKCILGLLEVSSGDSLVFGENSWNLTGATKARIGYVPQKVELLPWIRARHMIDYIASFYNNWNHRLVDSLVRDWELDVDQRVRDLSEGQRQKLGIIIAMGHEPELLLLDEPAASLDPQARRMFLSALIEVVANENRTVVLSTHLTSDLERIASDIVMLRNGGVDYAGPIDALKDSVKSLRLQGRRRLPETIDFPGVLSWKPQGNTGVLTLRGVTPEIIQELEALYDAEIEVWDLNLEDIFVGVHRG